MLARKLHITTAIAIFIGFAVGNISLISEIPLLLTLTPSTNGILTRFNSAAAASFSLSIIFCAFSTIIYSAINKEDTTTIQIFEWYGCMIFGGAMFIFFYWLATNLWSNSFPEIVHGRGAKAIYRLSTQNELWLNITNALLLFMGNFGLYLLSKVPFLLIKPLIQNRTTDQ